MHGTTSLRNRAALTVSALLAVSLAGCGDRAAVAGAEPTESAEQFVARVNRELNALGIEVAAAGFTQATYINKDTELLDARANGRYLERLSQLVEQAERYDGQPLPPDAARMLHLLELNVAAPAPPDPEKRAELTRLASRLEAMYGEGKYCPQGPESCKNLDELSEIIAKSRNYEELLDAWRGWHDIGGPMREPYRRFVELANEGAQALDYHNLGIMWRAGYDMSPEEFDREAERLWQQVKPLYDELHCHARAELAEVYGEERVPAGEPVPAHLFGNMWAQQWNKIYDDILKPYPKASIESADRRLRQQKWDALRMTRSAESFYTSLGFPALPAAFWERSMFTRPQDREVVCHASAWDMDDQGDVRIKMCIRPTEEDLFTVYHELGHVYYYLLYEKQPYLFQGGAHDGFHEAIGDTVNLSVTPEYLAKLGLVSEVKPSREAVINQQMKMAVEKIAFLPFGRLIDQWRWRVFSGEIRPEDYNRTWWELRRQYQGIAPPVERTEEHFDPGAKYHIPGNTPYTRYFLSFILQFQFHEALCEAAGHEGPLHECSIFGSQAAGERFAKMLSLGASQPWQDTMEELTGTRQMDASAIIEYFQPLMGWLKERNASRQCGWSG